MKRKFLALSLSASLLTSCSYFLDTTDWHYQKLNIASEPGQMCCTLSNDYGVWRVTTPADVRVHRSDKPLMVSCYKPGFLPIQKTIPSQIPLMRDGDLVPNYHPDKKNYEYNYPPHIYFKLTPIAAIPSSFKHCPGAPAASTSVHPHPHCQQQNCVAKTKN